MFLLGGYQLLRGFNAQSIYANAYAIGTVEYRYLIGQNSNFYVFSDFGESQFKNNATQYNDGFLSFGIGMAFETKAGIFNFNIASGKDRSNKFGLNNAKVNIGYVALF
jgi:hemolysin activation/secretion protein